MSDAKTCFVIGEIGAADSDARVDSDWLLDHVIKPVLENDPFNYVVTRADHVPDPGMISDQVINAVFDSDMVVADLTRFNPNVFYEVGIRHVIGKPIIHLMEEVAGVRIPFDVSDYRTIKFKTRSTADYGNLRAELTKQAKAVEARPDQVSNPVMRARGFQKLRVSGDPRDKLLAELSQSLAEISQRLAGLEGKEAVRAIAEAAAIDAVVHRPGGLGDLMMTATDRSRRGIGAYTATFDQYSQTPLPLRQSTATDVSGGSNVTKKP